MITAQPEGGCDLDNPKNWRTRTSIHVEMGGHHIRVDAAPEFRMQCIQAGLNQIDTFVLTHPHADHILGMDDLRRFCDLNGGESLADTGVHTDWSAFVRSFPMRF